MAECHFCTLLCEETRHSLESRKKGSKEGRSEGEHKKGEHEKCVQDYVPHATDCTLQKNYTSEQKCALHNKVVVCHFTFMSASCAFFRLGLTPLKLSFQDSSIPGPDNIHNYYNTIDYNPFAIFYILMTIL